jgi:hypothetical protein
MGEEGLEDRPRAEAIVREGDKVRSSFVSSIYGLRWDSMERFDLVMDTSKIGVDKAAAWIADAASALPPATADTARESLGPRVYADDPTLDEAVKAELGG